MGQQKYTKKSLTYPQLISFYVAALKRPTVKSGHF